MDFFVFSVFFYLSFLSFEVFIYALGAENDLASQSYIVPCQTRRLSQNFETAFFSFKNQSSA